MSYYTILFILSLVMGTVYGIFWRRRYSIYFTLIFLIVPFAIRGYILQDTAEIIAQALAGLRIIYVSAVFLLLFIMFAIFDLCNLKSVFRVKGLLAALALLMCIPLIKLGSNPYFYKSISLTFKNGCAELAKEYGPLHTVYYIFLTSFLVITISTIIFCLKTKKDVSKKNLLILLFCECSSVFLFFGTKLFKLKIELAPLAYILSEVILLTIIRRISLYDITENAVEAIAINGDTGFIFFDKRFTYFASNKLAKEVFPALHDINVDSDATKNDSLNAELIAKIKDFADDNSKNLFFKDVEDKIYQVTISFLYDRDKIRGYMVYIQDDTQDQKYISLLNDFNSKLKEEVAQKTENVIKMHDNLILGMATMVESRDNSTGGHIKRTSIVVKMLIDEILKDESDDALKLSADFCHNLIKAAPMHDLGKIAVDDAILRKPGRFTEEEFEIMKTHTTEGARIMHEILKETTDFDFHILAENVAHYHHERWDGTGYPGGLQGKTIPLEARIMAVADVYDALVSKRVYKEAMSFEQADSIMMKSFGKHFDRQLKKYYVAARPRLEAFYRDET